MNIRPCGQTDGHWTMWEGEHLEAQNEGFGESKPTESFPAEKCTLCDFKPYGLQHFVIVAL